MQYMKRVELAIFSTNSVVTLPITKMLAKMPSPFQDILVVDSEKYGKCLILDNIMQCAEMDHEIYDREMLKLLKSSDAKIVILGGGDGYIAEMAFHTSADRNITIVDLDLEVARCCKTYLGQRIFEERNVSLRTEEACQYLESSINDFDGKSDGIVCDLTDCPIGATDECSFEKYYERLIGLAHQNLSSNGWISIQAGASNADSEHIDASQILERLLQERFRKVHRSDIVVPSFGEECAFLFGEK